jgi:hypothetical protein
VSEIDDLLPPLEVQPLIQHKKARITHQHSSEGRSMSAPAHHPDAAQPDAVEAVVPLIPMVLPLAGAVLIFLLAFIAVSMA